MEITKLNISAIDVIALDIKSVDQLFPYIRDIQLSFSSFPNLPPSFVGIATLKRWSDFFQTKQATDELTEQELRQLKFDLENTMNAFNENVLGAKK